jgi:mannitol/fructose-specific phosphotransferase system IIA component (Ntr-type)
MSLPISLVQAVQQGREIHACPQCARMLYYPESHPRRTGERTRRTGPRKVGISRFSSHTLMIPRLEATDKEAAIEELAHKMGDEGFVDRPDWLIEEALRREAILTTALEHGMAVPHVRHVEGGGLALALGISRKGIDWGGSGKTLTRIIFFMAIPTAASAFYLKLLAGLAESFMKAESRKAFSPKRTRRSSGSSSSASPARPSSRAAFGRDYQATRLPGYQATRPHDHVIAKHRSYMSYTTYGSYSPYPSAKGHGGCRTISETTSSSPGTPCTGAPDSCP